jgi:hypothetical protein
MRGYGILHQQLSVISYEKKAWWQPGVMALNNASKEGQRRGDGRMADVAANGVKNEKSAGHRYTLQQNIAKTWRNIESTATLA